SPVRELRPPGSVRGVSSNGYPYRDNYLQRLRWPGGSVCTYCAEIGDPRRIATCPS
ncbi:hypothetical protein JKG47_20995, partial [Acidithiobacillus sp. MC6.1]|nr:hypothetical protein [Acidithiobacillus sp. MC6.1]